VEIKQPFKPKMKTEPGTKGTESPWVTEGRGLGHPVLGGSSYSQHHPTGAFPYSQQDLFPEQQENISDAPGDDDEEEEEQE